MKPSFDVNELKDDDWISTIQAAQIARVARTTVNYWVRHYGLKTRATPGGRYKIRVGDFYDFIKFHNVQHRSKLMRKNAKYSIAIVDQSRARREKYSAYLSNAYNVSFVEMGAAEKTLSELRPHLLIIEPATGTEDRNGWETLKAIMNAKTLEGLIVMIVSRKYDEDDVVRGFELGARDYVKAPLGERETLARVKNLLRNAVTL